MQLAKETPELFDQAVQIDMDHRRLGLDAYSRLFAVGPSVVEEFLQAQSKAPIEHAEPFEVSNIISLAERRRTVGGRA